MIIKAEEMEKVMYGDRVKEFIPEKKKPKLLADIYHAESLFRKNRIDKINILDKTSKDIKMLKCAICGYEHEFMIAPTHIKKHGLTTLEYKQKFPESALRIQTEFSKNKISQNKKGKSNEKLKNRVFSEEHKLKIKEYNL